MKIVSTFLNYLKYFYLLKTNRIYKNCEELPFSVFVTCLVENNYKQLVKTKHKVNIKYLELRFNNIYAEFCDLIDNNSFKRLLKLMQELKQIECNLIKYNLIKYLLESGFEKNEIKKLHYNINFENVETEIKNLSFLKKVKEKNIETLKTESEKAVLTKKYFYEQLILLSKFVGYRLKAEDITVAEYCAIFNNYKKQLEDGTKGENR